MGIAAHDSTTTPRNLPRHLSLVRSPYVAALLALFSCNLDVQPPLSDADGDGFPAYADGGADCDDQDPATFPGAPDPCDGKDQSCDGVIDDETILYLDADGDGYGAEARLGCPDSPGTSPLNGDCDDGAPTTFPGADDTCDDLADADCDGFPCLSGVHTQDDAVTWPLDGTPELLWAQDGHLRVAGTSGTASSPMIWSFDADTALPGTLTALPVAAPVLTLLRPEQSDTGTSVVGVSDQIGWISPTSSTFFDLPGLGAQLADRGDTTVWASHPEEGTIYVVSPTSGPTWFANGGATLVRLDLDGDGMLDLATGSAEQVVVLSFEGTEIDSFNADASRGLSAGDLDGDGLEDLASRGVDGVQLWSAWTVYDPDWGALATLETDGAVQLTDADADGRADLLLVPESGESLLFYADQLQGAVGEPSAAGVFPAGPIVAGVVLGSGGADVVAGREGALWIWAGGPG